jgi:hypothetical protein
MSLGLDAPLDARDLLEPWFLPEYAQTPELAGYVSAHAVEAPVLARGIFWYEDQKEDFEAAVKDFMEQGWNVDEGIGPFAAFSEEVEVAKDFADQAVYGVVLVVEGLKGVSVLGLLKESGQAGVNVQREKEWLVPCGQRVRFERMERVGDISFLHGRLA